MSIRCSSDRCCFFRFFLLVVVDVADDSDFEAVAADVVGCSSSLSLEEGKRQNKHHDHRLFDTHQSDADDRKEKSHVETAVTQNKRSNTENDENRVPLFLVSFNDHFSIRSSHYIHLLASSPIDTHTICEQLASRLRSVSHARL